MKKISLSEMVTYSTVLIRCQYNNGSSGSGTGFIINLCMNEETKQCVPVIVTNKHVVLDNKICEFEFCRADENGNPIDNRVFSFRYDDSTWVMHPDDDVDLCCLPIGAALNEIQAKGIKLFYIPLEMSIIPTQTQIEELSAMENLVMVGYPIGLSDTFNHKPVLRRGCSATHIKNDYQGKKEFLLDMACFPGSSGSPVFVLNEGSFSTPQGLCAGNRIYLVGILYGGPQFSATGIISFATLPKVPTPIVNIPTNLGIAVKANKIFDFETIFNTSK